MEIQHYKDCSPIYPEKVLGEAPRATIIMNLEDGTRVEQCVDCGAFIIIEEQKE